ncbi:hypothetical protein BZG02_04740 [Labilibaculum filiforme]|uniref:Spi protease inhibitor domain-containing protein n=1 Tax=Labilibaculum filiforme TaxID=1940526 RepID=A0A2N3I490_9BACT|nr:hypothetical protein [Labilibaculum filiforme]PKQ65137.1 hypothetical protein BZG02_04740 [Labilibaculum filiforme]
MKNYLFILSSFLASIFLAACDGDATINFPTNIIQDSRVSDSTFQILLDDARLLCLNLYLNEETQELNDIEINESHVAPFVSALQMVFLDSLLPATQEIRNYQIHALCRLQLHQGILLSDTINTPINSWYRNGYSDYKALDNYIYKYSISLDSIGNNQYKYQSEIGINQLALASELKSMAFILNAKASSCIGDGSQIEIMDYSSDFIHLIYSYGWGDCPSGCINRHYWELGVYGSGMVEIIAESGSKLP